MYNRLVAMDRTQERLDASTRVDNDASIAENRDQDGTLASSSRMQPKPEASTALFVEEFTNSA